MKSILSGLLDSASSYNLHLYRTTKQKELTVSEWRLLGHIVDGLDTQEKLSDFTRLDISTLSRQLKRLFEKEMVTKVAVGKDRRQLVYSPTDKGNNALRSINEEIRKANDVVFNHWTEEEKKLLKILINRLDKSINRL
ncbi:MarR family winged helix-turn-helix transcriptional regulator [Lentilactobacillus sp. Marseille-Q4993]|uniref:MarR family winged helix-turn-helix transcriptional regulator n=1 Tax=Lentilactobacillus sp. Marseille-Q4993 TaxID=3039492 RepID=UPI0024BC47FE|nr:MarR family winged helix-turn-helix transcriptional regulator [Lentilactobacillus sp. Marseille-Q4993]